MNDRIRRDLCPDVSVILPIHNERENISQLLGEIELALAAHPGGYEVIAVDDGSTDGSDQLLREMLLERPSLRVLLLSRNFGQSAAFDAAFQRAAGRVFITLDADGQNDPADIPRMLQVLEQDDLDFLIGERADRKDARLLRKLPSRLANFLIRRVTGTRLRDLGCSLKLYRRELARELRLYGEMHRFIGVLVESLGARTGQVPVNHRPRIAGKSKYGLGRTVKVLLDLITVWFMRGYQAKPIYVFGGMGILLMAGAVLLSAVVLYEKLALHVWVHRNPLFILSMIMSIIAGQFLGLGLMAEIVVRTYFESSHKSPYVIRDALGFVAQGQHPRGRRRPLVVSIDPNMRGPAHEPSNPPRSLA